MEANWLRDGLILYGLVGAVLLTLQVARWVMTKFRKWVSSFKGKSEEVFVSSDVEKMSDWGYINYLEREILVNQIYYQSFFDNFQTRFIGMEPDTLTRLMEKSFYKVMDLLVAYDNEKVSAQQTLDLLRAFMKALFGPANDEARRDKLNGLFDLHEKLVAQSLQEARPKQTLFRRQSVFYGKTFLHL